MNNFPDFDFEGLGGVKTFSFIPVHDILDIPHSISGSLITAISIKVGKNWYLGKALPKSLSFEEKLDKAGVYQYTIKGKAAGDSSVMVPLFDDMARREHIVDIEDNKDMRRLLGTNEYGMSFTWQHKTGDAPASRNEYTFTFKIKLVLPAVFYNPPSPL